MYAIVDIAGQQFKVEKDQKIYVNRLDAEEGSKVDFDKVLLIDDGGKVKVGLPILNNFVVSASVLSHLKGDKVKVFKKKRRKGYQVLNGHRQSLTQLLIESIGEGKAKAKVSAKKEAELKPTVAEKPKSETVTEAKASGEKKSVAKKPAADTIKAEKPATVKKTSTEKKADKPAAKATPKKETKPVAKKAAPKAKKEAAPKAKAAPKKKEEKEK